MGMLGAMAGLGKGMQDFSTLMNEKSKMDWLAQQEAVKHERALSLENLRMQNQMVVAEKQNTWANERQGQQNTFVASESALNREATRENTMAPYSEDALGAKERAARTEARIRGDEEIRVLGAKNSAALEQAESVYRLTSKLDMEKRREYAEQLKATEQYQSASPEAQKQMELAALQPEVAKFMAELQKGNQREIPFEQQRLALKDGRDFFQTLPEDQRKNYKAQLTKETGKSYTDLQAAEEYAQDQLGYLINLNSSRKSGTQKKSPSISYDPSTDIPKIMAMDPKQQEVALSKIKAADNDLYLKVSRDIANATNPSAKSQVEEQPGMLRRGASAVMNFAQRNVDPGADAQVRRANPQGKYESDFAYNLRIQNLVGSK